MVLMNESLLGIAVPFLTVSQCRRDTDKRSPDIYLSGFVVRERLTSNFSQAGSVTGCGRAKSISHELPETRKWPAWAISQFSFNLADRRRHDIDWVRSELSDRVGGLHLYTKRPDWLVAG